jgi:histidyl-tRNA synthetase
MDRIKPRTLSGFMELLPPLQVYFDAMERRLCDSFSLFGFTPLDTPLMEAAEILLAKGGGETEKQIYRIQKGDTDLALRYELTASLAKYTALNYGRLSFPFRRYEIGKVYRGERAQRGRFREFYQADIDIIGDGALDIINDAEIPSIIYRCFTSLGLNRFVIHVNNRKVLSGFFELIGIGGAATDVMRAVDKLDKIGEEKLLETLTEEQGVSKGQADEIMGLVTFRGDPFDILGTYRGKNATLDEGIGELAAVKRHIAGFGVPESHCIVDLAIARGLDYYTGTVYETSLADYPDVGSVCSGGRYDNLAECYTDKRLPGVGISIGLTRLFYILQEQSLLNESALTSPADVLIIPMTDDLSHAVSLATTMRGFGLRAQIHGENKKFKSKLSYADKLGIPFVAFLGEDEISSGMITVKEMSSGSQTTASAGILTAGIAEKIAALRSGAPIKER